MARMVYLEPAGALKSSIDYYYGQAAVGPDYGVGAGEWPEMPTRWWANVKGYRPALVTIEPENYAAIGPPRTMGIIPQDNVGLSDLSVANNPVNSPAYNSATPQGLFHLKVDNAQQYARWQVNSYASNIGQPAPIPVTFSAGSAATLYGGK